MFGAGDNTLKEAAVCRYCGNKLGLIQRVAKSEFCSPAHRDACRREQEELALACLQEAMAIPEALPSEPEPVPEAEPVVEETSHRAAFADPGSPAMEAAGHRQAQDDAPAEAGFVAQGCSLGPYYPVLDAEDCEPVFEEFARPQHGLTGPAAARVEHVLEEAGHVYDPEARTGVSEVAQVAVAVGSRVAVVALPRFDVRTLFDAEAALASERPVEADPPMAELEPGLPGMPGASVPLEVRLGHAGDRYDPAEGTARLPRFDVAMLFDPEAALASAEADPPMAELAPGVPGMPGPSLRVEVRLRPGGDGYDPAEGTARLPRFDVAMLFAAEAALASAEADPPMADLAPGVPGMPGASRPVTVRADCVEQAIERGMAPDLAPLRRRRVAVRLSGPPVRRSLVKATLQLQDAAAAPLLEPIPFDFGSLEDAWQPEF